MKNDKDKEAKLAAVEKELNQKIEQLMGPTIEEQAPASKRISPAEAADPSAKRKNNEPSTAPEIGEQTEQIKSETVEQPIQAEVDESDQSLDPEIDKAVDEIAAQEADEILKAEDEAVQKAFAPASQKSFTQKIKEFFKKWWNNPRARKATITGLLVTIVVLGTVPTSRYFVLNMLGVRSSASIKILDDSTQQPLKNVSVTLSGQTGITDDNGYVKLSPIKLGKQQMQVDRRAFASTTRAVTIGWGSNPLPDLALSPTGLQYSFKTVDFLSGKPIIKAEAISGEFSAFSNENGEILLTVDTKADEDVSVTIKAEGYRDETMVAAANTTEVKMVAGTKHLFVSKRSGKYDIYKIDADGKYEELVLSGTGAERDDLVLAAHPNRSVAALMSTRENLRNSDGYLLNTITIIDAITNEKKDIDRSEQFKIVGWANDRLIYVKVVSGGSTAKPGRHKLISYDYTTGDSTELAKSNYFNDVLLANGKIYYAPSPQVGDAAEAKLFAVNPDGGDKVTLIDNETWNIFRTSYDKLTIAVGQTWYEHTLGSNEPPIVLNGAPASPKSRLYINSADNKSSLWTEQRDGKGVLLAYNSENQEDKNLAAASGLTSPFRWLNHSTIVYRVKTDQETADYIVSLDGGESKKLVDVTNTSGIEAWYYY